MADAGYATQGEVDYPCPYCQRRNLQTRANVPYVRGMLIAYMMGQKRLVGCVKCVRGEIFKQQGLSLLVGWFSPVALVANPLFITYGLIRGLFVFPNPVGVRSLLAEAGIPDPGDKVDVMKACYALAATMIRADGKVDPAEVETATRLGGELIPGFDAAEFEAVVAGNRVPDDPYILAGLLRNVLSDDARQRVFDYLVAIANADGELAKEEERLLDGVRVTLALRRRVEALAA
ncbi:MAG: TerB family tellurite resistance protein [Hyphomonadaceae bacterium]|nr:TerB family tellurite resistance protein [Hyphomonadaceae bacterium]